MQGDPVFADRPGRGIAFDGEDRASYARAWAGRLVKVRVRELKSLADVESLDAQVFAAIARTGPGAVICADFRQASPLSPQVASAWSRGMRRANRNISRSALLLDPSNTMFNLQIVRVVRCAGNDARRICSGLREVDD